MGNKKKNQKTKKMKNFINALILATASATTEFLPLQGT